MITVILVVIAAFLYYIYFQQRYGYWKRLGVKGPTPIPFAGTFFSEKLRDGQQLEKGFLKKYGEVYGTYTFGQRVLNTARPDHIKTVLSDKVSFHNFGMLFINDNYAHKSVFFSNGQRWKTHRAAMSHHFTSRKLKSILSYFESVCDHFISNVEFLKEKNKTDVVEIRKLCRCFTIDTICKFMVSVDVDSFKLAQEKSEFAKFALRVGHVNLVHLVLMSFIPKFFWKWLNLNIFYRDPFDKVGDTFKKLIQQRDPNLRYNDFIELFVDQIQEGKLKATLDDAIGNAMISFFAGTDTTSNAMVKAFYYLATEPAVRERLQEELRRDFKDGITYEGLVEHQYLGAFVNEVLRLGQSLLTLDRLVTKDVQLGDLKLAKGDIVHLITYLNHVSEKHFPDPEKFDVNRWMDRSALNPNAINRNEIYAPFSMGNRQCIGMRFALLEIKYLITRVLLEYDIFKPDNFKLKELSARRFCNPTRMNIGLRKRRRSFAKSKSQVSVSHSKF